MKLKKGCGPSLIRLVGPGREGGGYFVPVVGHAPKYNPSVEKNLYVYRDLTADGPDERMCIPMCLHWLFTAAPKYLLELAVEGKWITQNDHDSFKEHGCPFCGLPDDSNDRLRKSYMTNAIVVNDAAGQDNLVGTNSLWSMTAATHETIQKERAISAKLLHPVEGRAIWVTPPSDKVKYYTVSRADEPMEIPEYQGDLYDLEDLFCKGIKAFHQMVDMLSYNVTHLDEKTRLRSLPVGPPTAATAKPTITNEDIPF